MTRRHVVWPTEAREQFDAIAKTDPHAVDLILPAVYALGHDPYPPDSSVLGSSGTYRRLHLGDYRITYAVLEEQIRVVLIARAAGLADLY